MALNLPSVSELDQEINRLVGIRNLMADTKVKVVPVTASASPAPTKKTSAKKAPAKAATKSAPAKKTTSKTGTRKPLPAATKKRIAEAQKARWAAIKKSQGK